MKTDSWPVTLMFATAVATWLAACVALIAHGGLVLSGSVPSGALVMPEVVAAAIVFGATWVNVVGLCRQWFVNPVSEDDE